ncbi:MAG: TolC family protein [Kofleriaceae bacterium]|nr:TolC family protein [Kofleriaceae bacterium]
MVRSLPLVGSIISVLAGPTVVLAQGGAAEDPLLAPPPPAPRLVSSWSEVRGLLAHATSTRRVIARRDRARAEQGLARAGLHPRASATAGLTGDLLHPDRAPGVAPVSDVEPTAPLLTVALGASWPLLDGAARRRRAAADASARGADLDVVDTERALVAGAARALLAVRAAIRASDLHRLGLRQAQERAALVARTFQLGAATELDVVRTAQDVALARSAVIAGDEVLRAAREDLGLVLAIGGEVGLAGTLAGPEHEAGADLLAQITDHCRPLAAGELRADRARARAEVAAAQAEHAAARAQAWPTLELASGVSAYSARPAPGHVPAWTLGLVVRVPLWEGGARAAAIELRAAGVAEAEAARDELDRVASVDAQRARRGDAVARALVASARDARGYAQRVDGMIRRAFEIGRATSLELVQSASALRQAELALAGREVDQEAAAIEARLAEARCAP